MTSFFSVFDCGLAGFATWRRLRGGHWHYSWGSEFQGPFWARYEDDSACSCTTGNRPWPGFGGGCEDRNASTGAKRPKEQE